MREIRLTWRDALNGAQQQFSGRGTVRIGSAPDNDVVLATTAARDYHAELIRRGDDWWLIASDTLLLNGRHVAEAALVDGDELRFGPIALRLSLVKTPGGTNAPPRLAPSIRHFRQRRGASRPPRTSYPPPGWDAQHVPVAGLRQSGLPLSETTYLALGGGLGSFEWVDFLRVCGVPASAVRVVGESASPYDRFRRWCRHSQITDDDRLRSDSGAMPDNVWGWPGYAVREALGDLRHLNLGRAAATMWQIVAEPDLRNTYTPKAGQVYRSIDREARRIDWASMFVPGQILAVRMTDDGRYAVACRHDGETRIVLARIVHLALGYAGLRFSNELRAWRKTTGDLHRVVNAYEGHDHIYTQLAERGGTVLLRGRGIVASRVLERLHAVGTTNPHVRVVHLMNAPNPAANSYEGAARLNDNHWAIQPFNWPKAAFSGDLRAQFASANEPTRARLMTDWGGTTTADRRDWRAIVDEGLRQGWYQVRFAALSALTPNGDGRLHLTLTDNRPQSDETSTLSADFVIDATGLNAALDANPVLADLARHYALPRNPRGNLPVDAHFATPALSNGDGRMFASGINTLGGDYVPVDSFMGMQYSALCSLLHLNALRAPHVRPLTPWRSAGQWLRWAAGVAP